MKQTTKNFVLALAALSIFGIGAGSSGQAQAATETASSQQKHRICSVSNFDTRGCKKGDVVLYLPSQWGNEQLPVEFAGKKCDLTKQVVWTKGGVTCIYAGPGKFVDGAEEVERMSYAKLYEQVRSNLKGWTEFQTNNGSFVYWRVVELGKGGPIKEGDRVKGYDTACIHDIDGNEKLDKANTKSQIIEKINKDYYVMEIGATYGSTIEEVSEFGHHFYKLEKAGGQSKKNNKPKTKS